MFVEFAEKPMADGFLGLPTIKFNDTELIKESKLVIFHYLCCWVLKNGVDIQGGIL